MDLSVLQNSLTIFGGNFNSYFSKELRRKFTTGKYEYKIIRHF